MELRNLLLSGGVGHPFPTTSGLLADILAESGFTSVVFEDFEQGLEELRTGDFDLVTVNALRWRMDVERYAHLRDEHALSLSDAARESLETYVREGGRLLAIHTASICFDDWATWGEILGARWDWERSFHPPLGAMTVAIADDAHPFVRGLEAFSLTDEAYGFLDEQPGLRPLLTSEHGGRAHPLLWERTYGAGLVVYDALGHDERSFESPEHREILRRIATYLQTNTQS
jgi:type 1 glutamine amidotransferase